MINYNKYICLIYLSLAYVLFLSVVAVICYPVINLHTHVNENLPPLVNIYC